MTTGDPIEEQCVRMWKMVLGNPAHTLDDARRAFWLQEQSVIDGWERLAANVLSITTTATLEYTHSLKRPRSAEHCSAPL